MKQNYNRREFIRTASVAGVGLTLAGHIPSYAGKIDAGKRVGIIGLDTSHCVVFTKALNDPAADAGLSGYKVVAAYPKGSNDIAASVSRIPGFTEELKKQGVEIVGSIDELLKKVDVVLLETNDARLHLEQALPVIKAGKPLFIDKPVAHSLADAIAIFNLAKQHNVPVFSSSALRFMATAQAVVQGKVGKVLGATTHSPATIEKTHPDLFWYGVHGVETLFTVMGKGCKSVTRIYTPDTDIVVGIWDDDRIGTFRGTRTGVSDFGGKVFGQKGNALLGPWEGYKPLLLQITEFFRTGKAPVTPEETLEIIAFMEAADESKKNGGASVSMQSVIQRAGKGTRI